MEGKILCCLVALVAYCTAASISGTAGIDNSQAYIGGYLNFGLPHFFNPFHIFNRNNNNNNSGNDTSDGNSTDNNSNLNYNGSPFGPFAPFLQIPGLNLLLPQMSHSLPDFSNLGDLIERIQNRNNGNDTTNGTSPITIPPFSPLPGLNQLPYIPGLSDALRHARKHVQAALNITTDLATGLHNMTEVALNSDDPGAAIGVMLNAIAKAYSTFAANCPLIVGGAIVLDEGIRLVGEVIRSVFNVATRFRNYEVEY